MEPFEGNPLEAAPDSLTVAESALRERNIEVTDEHLFLVASAIVPGKNMELNEGMTLAMRDKDTDQSVEAYVTELREDGVLMDLNHPLAGETLFFDVEIISLRPAAPAELAHGHVHSSTHNH